MISFVGYNYMVSWKDLFKEVKLKLVDIPEKDYLIIANGVMKA